MNATPRAGKARTDSRSRHLIPLLSSLCATVAVGLLWPPDAEAVPRIEGPPSVRLDHPRANEISGYGAVADVQVERRLAAQLPPSWGGQYTTSRGERVTVYASRSYVEDPASNQRWAEFLGGLIHGSELASVTLFLAPFREVQSVCGRGAAACYSPRERLIVTPGDDLPEISAETIVTHEYGHHVAANRSNAPWEAIDWGTKRWATAENVCSRTQAGQLFPGNESTLYELNPGEGFAESYRLLHERKAGVPETPWLVVDRRLYPSAAALAGLEQDVLNPWLANTTSVITGTVTARRRISTSAVATPLDGSLRVTFRAPARARFSVALLRGSTVVGRAVAGPSSRTRALSTTVCGTRNFRVRVTRLAGAGRFTATVSKP